MAIHIKEKALNWDLLTVSEVELVFIVEVILVICMQTASGEVSESSIFRSRDSRKRERPLGLAEQFETSKLTIKWHTSSTKATLPNPSQVVPLLMTKDSKV